MFQEDAINLVKKHNAKLLTIEELQEMHNKKQLDRKAYWSNNTNQRFLAM
ncbi:MAG: hypothetical protein LBU14_00805 [Candidatus Peribacteria bacterium]|jgi:hypothetical protein|nr:hypothetical protein [Candidatus Peribacteria bacterium]